MKLFLKICKWAGILIGIGGLCFVSHSAGMAKAKDMTLTEYWKSCIEKTVEEPKDEENQDIVDVPEIEDETQTEEE